MAMRLEDLEKQGFHFDGEKLVKREQSTEGNDQGLSERDLKSKLRAQTIKARDTRSKLLETRARLKESQQTLLAQDGIARAFDPVAKLFMAGTGLVFGFFIVAILILLAIMLAAIVGVSNLGKLIVVALIGIGIRAGLKAR